MAKVTGPLLSLAARGQIAKTQVFATWRGVAYARLLVIPSNPNTAGQQATRSAFRTLQEVFKLLPATSKNVWAQSIVGRPLTAANSHIKTNLPLIRAEANMQEYLGSPGVGGAPPLDSIAVTPGVGQLTVDVTEGEVPAGWTITQAVAMAFPDQDPAVAFGGPMTIGTDLSSPFQIVLTLPTGILHVVTAWIELTRADGSFAASIASTATGTPS